MRYTGVARGWNVSLNACARVCMRVCRTIPLGARDGATNEKRDRGQPLFIRKCPRIRPSADSIEEGGTNRLGFTLAFLVMVGVRDTLDLRFPRSSRLTAYILRSASYNGQWFESTNVCTNFRDFRYREDVKSFDRPFWAKSSIE